MFRLSLTLLLAWACGTLPAQSGVDFGRTDANVPSARFTVDGAELTQYVLDDMPAEYRDRLDERTALRFADQTARGTASILTSGRAYNGWDDLDAYVNQVLTRVAPPEMRDKTYLRAYVLKDGNANAFMTPTGLFFINIGMIEAVQDENGLAGIIAHEIAHYTRRHGLERFVAQESGEFKASIFYNADKVASAFSIDNELDADATAARYLTDAGYDVAGLEDAFGVFERIEKKILLTKLYDWKLKETTHPNSTRRIEKMRAFAEAQDPATLRPPFRDAAAYAELRATARPEVLKYLMASLNHRGCLEKAFVYHLYEPANPTYAYYVLEAIRRAAYLDATLWNKTFLTDGHYDVIDKNGKPVKQVITDNFFSEFRGGILALDAAALDDLPAKFYWQGPPKFRSYEEAFAYFFRVCKVLKEPEALLTNALSLSFDVKLRDKFLTDYLAAGEVRHADYARALLDGKIYDALPERALTAFHNFIPVIKNGVDDIPIWQRAEYEGLSAAMEQAVTTTGNRKYLYLPSLKETNINDYLTLASLEGFSGRYLVARGEKTELHILNPEYWNLLKRLGVNQVEFVNVIYNDKEKGAFTTDTYHKVMTTSFSDLLGRDDEKGRYVKMFIQGLRIHPTDDMKIRAYDGSDRLGSKGTGYDLLAELLRDKLADLD